MSVLTDQQTGINSLPDETLQGIFAYLDIKQRIQIERVCKRWRAIGRDIPWTWPKKIDSERDVKNVKLSDTILESILSRCGKRLRELSLDMYEELTAVSLKSIAIHCLNLTDVFLSQIPLTESNLKLLGQRCTKLKSVKLCQYRKLFDTNSTLDFNDVGLGAFLEECNGLQRLDISENSHLTGEAFGSIGKSLSALHICSGITPASMELLMTRCSTLAELRMEFCDKLEGILPRLFDTYASTLKVLYMEGFKTYNKWCESVTLLHNLEELSLDECENIDDKFMKTVSKQCIKLRALSIVECVQVTDQGLTHLAAMPCLKVLDISYADGVRGNGVEVIAAQGHLEELYARASPVTDRNCSTLAIYCPNFCSLDVSNSIRISNELVKPFRDAVKSGFLKSNVQLEVGGTFVDEDVETCDRLKVTFRNTSRQGLPAKMYCQLTGTVPRDFLDAGSDDEDSDSNHGDGNDEHGNHYLQYFDENDYGMLFGELL